MSIEMCCRICLILVIYLTICSAWKAGWTRNEDSTKTLKITVEKASDPVFPPSLNYSRYDEIQLKNAKISSLTREGQLHILKIFKFRVIGGSIESIHLQPEFKVLDIQNSSTSDAVINPARDYQTQHLTIVYNKLGKTPKHLNVLKHLLELFLNNNQIEFVEMAEFNGLDKLRYIALQNNQICEISATIQTPVFLPNLIKFAIFNNLLTNINFEYWNTTALGILSLHSNQLRIALSFPSAFPALFNVALDSNPWNCEWLKVTLNELKTREVTLFDENTITCNSTGPSLEGLVRQTKLQHTFPTVGQLREKFEQKALNQDLTEKVKRLQKENEDLRNELARKEQEFKQMVVNLEKSFLAKLDTVLNISHKLQHKDDDLTEVLYLHLLEDHSPEDAEGTK